jgi:hypothetical protein
MAHASARSARADVYSRITDEIVAAIEHGAGDWHMPWHHDGGSIARPRNVASDRPYRGINILALWVAATRSGYTGGTWGTYRQWAERGCQVRRGETATTVVFWKTIDGRNTVGDDADRLDHDEGGARPASSRAAIMSSTKPRWTGLRRASCRGCQNRSASPTPTPSSRRSRYPSSSRAAKRATAPTSIRYSCRRSSASSMQPASIPRWDTNAATRWSMRPASTATSPAASARPSTPWTRPWPYLDSFVMADLGIAHRPREEHAAYLRSWLPVLKSDPRAIFTAAGKAQQAADWMHAQQPSPAGTGAMIAGRHPARGRGMRGISRRPR